MRSTARIALQVLGALFAVLAVLFGLAAWRLSSGPLSVGFLSPYIEEALQGDDLAYRIKFEDTVLVWAGWSHPLEIQVTEVHVEDPSGTTLAQVPAASLGMSGAALLRGVIAPTSIALHGLRLALVRDPDGEVSLAGSDGELGPDDDATDSLVADLLDPPREEDHPLAQLRRVSLRDASLALHDDVSGLTWEAPKADLTLDMDEAAIVGRLSMDLQVRDVETRLHVQLFHHRESKMGSAAVEFAGLNPAQLASAAPEFEDFVGLRVPLSGTVALDLAPGGAFAGAVFEIVGETGEVSMPDVFPAPVSVRRLTAAGSVDDTLSRLDLDSFVMETDRPSFSLKGQFWRDDAGIGVRGEFQARDMPFNSLGDYWPESLIRPGRAWIVENVTEGTITRFDATLDLEPGALEHGRFSADAAIGTLAFENASVHFLRPMPPVSGVDGTGRFTPNELELAMNGGSVAGIAASRGTALLSGITGDDPQMTTMVEAEGAAIDALRLLDHPRLTLVSKAGLRPEQVGGTVSTLFSVDLPLDMSIEPEQVSVSAVARVRDARMDEIAGTVDLTEGALRLGVDNASMEVRGPARLQGMPATILWQERFGADAPFARRYDVSTTVTPEGLAALGLDLAPYVQGSLVLDGDFIDPGGGETPRATVRLDARDAELAIPDLYWSKSAGEPATVHVAAAVPLEGPVELTRVELETETLSALGRASLARGAGAAQEITIERLRYGATDIAGRIETDGDGTRLSVRGRSLDARPYIRRLMEEDSEETGPLALVLDIERVLTADDHQMTNVRARFETDPDNRHAGFMDATLASGEPFRFTLEPQAGKRLLTVRSSDAGEVARTFDIYDNAVGGDLLLEAVLHDDQPGEPIEGTVWIDDYRVLNAPTLARLLSIAALTGIVDALRGEGIGFSKFELPFSLENDVLTVKDARASGFAIGVNAEGTVNLDTDEVDMRGTVVPAYSLNTLINIVPILGDLLTGGEGEGIFAATYRVSGTTEDPDVSVNPLAALAPGFLRDLFSFLEEGASDEAE